jgi:ribosomal protein S12 methylthiotransferase accessory factor
VVRLLHPQPDHTDTPTVTNDGPDVHVGARWVTIGPWRPGGGRPAGCSDCLRIRWQRIRSESELGVIAAGSSVRRTGQWPLITGFLVDAVYLVLRWIADQPADSDDDTGQGYVTSVDVQTLRAHTVPILADPRCPTCAQWRDDDPADAVPALTRRPKPAADIFRLCAVENYPLPLDALVNEVCGAVGSSLWNDLGSSTTAPVSGRLAIRAQSTSPELTWSGQRTDYRSSTVVGLLEGLERYAGSLRRKPLRPVVASLAQLLADGTPVVDPRTCGLYAETVYRDDGGISPFTPDRVLSWVWGFSLRDQAPILVAQRNAFYGDHSAAEAFVAECSSGCASGSCPEEAMLYGLLEVIERDAFLLGWYGRAQLPAIAVDDELGRDSALLVARGGLLGYDITLLDNRIDLDVPVVTAVARRRDGGDGSLVFASAAALDPGQAVAGALGEILTYLPGRAHQVEVRRAELEAMAADFSLVHRLRDHAELFGLPAMQVHAGEYLAPGSVAGLRETFADYRSRRSPTTDLREDLDRLVSDVAALGFDVVTVDQTCPEQTAAGVTGVRMIVPGLVPIDFGWSRQRVLAMPRLTDAFGHPRAAHLAPAAGLRIVPHPFP